MHVEHVICRAFQFSVVLAFNDKVENGLELYCRINYKQPPSNKNSE